MSEQPYIERDGVKYYTVEIVAHVWEGIVRGGLISRDNWIMGDYKIRNEKYPDNYKWVQAKREAREAYKRLKEIEESLR